MSHFTVMVNIGSDVDPTDVNSEGEFFFPGGEDGD